MIAKLIVMARRTAFRKGVVGTSSRWLGVWAGLAVARQVRQRLGKGDQVVVERITLKKGEAIEIRDTGVPRESFEAR